MSLHSDHAAKKSRRRRRWGVFLLALGLLALLFAGVVTAKRLAFLGRAHSAPGVVVDMVRMSSGRISQAGREATAPRVRFVLGAAQHEFVSALGSYPPLFAAGDAVRVLYDPADPEHAEVDHPGQFWGPVLVSGVLGLLLSALGGWLRRVPRAVSRGTRPGKRAR
ncbi:MAG TPA: DUF3592 domain-containing protein [Rubrivivax sp.]|nr:DUF3592 domain-containing protein [Rubrivivax sp.]